MQKHHSVMRVDVCFSVAAEKEQRFIQEVEGEAAGVSGIILK